MPLSFAVFFYLLHLFILFPSSQQYTYTTTYSSQIVRFLSCVNMDWKGCGLNCDMRVYYLVFLRTSATTICAYLHARYAHLSLHDIDIERHVMTWSTFHFSSSYFSSYLSTHTHICCVHWISSDYLMRLVNRFFGHHTASFLSGSITRILRVTSLQRCFSSKPFMQIKTMEQVPSRLI